MINDSSASKTRQDSSQYFDKTQIQVQFSNTYTQASDQARLNIDTTQDSKTQNPDAYTYSQ